MNVKIAASAANEIGAQTQTGVAAVTNTLNSVFDDSEVSNSAELEQDNRTRK